MKDIPVEQVWFQNEYVYLAGYFIFFILPAILLLLGNIYKPNLPFYALTRKQYNLSEKTYTYIYTGLLILGVVCYISGNFRFFDGIAVLSNDRVKFYYFHPAQSKIVDFNDILSYKIIPDANNDENIGYLEIELKDGGWIRSKFLTQEDKDKLNSAIQMLEKLNIKEQ